MDVESVIAFEAMAYPSTKGNPARSSRCQCPHCSMPCCAMLRALKRLKRSNLIWLWLQSDHHLIPKS